MADPQTAPQTSPNDDSNWVTVPSNGQTAASVQSPTGIAPVATKSAAQYIAGSGAPAGLVQPGNLDIAHRPVVQNADGSHSTEYSVSFQDNKGREVLVPTVVNGKFLTPDGKKPPEGSPAEKQMFQKAWQHYEQSGEHLGMFDSPDHADQYANTLHSRGNQPTQTNQQQAQPPSVDSDWVTVPPVSQQGSQSPDAHPLLHGAFNMAEDIAYPYVGAGVGGLLGAVAGGPAAPATGLAGAALGSVAGEELKRAVRQNTGRGNLNPTGAAHVAEDLTAGAGGGAQEFSTFQKAAGQIIPKVLEDAKAMGIDLTPGTTGGKLLSVIEGYLRTAPKTAATINQTVDKVTNQSILAKGSDLADSIAKASLEKDPQVLGNTIAEAGQQVKNQATAGYNQAVRSAQKLNAPANSQQAIQAAEQFRANVADNMSASIIKQLMKNESPENAAKYLLANGSSLSNAQALTAAIGSKGQNVVSGAVLKELLDQSTNEANQTLKPSTLMAKWNDLGPAAQQALFPNPAHRDAVQTFLNVMDRYAQPISAVAGPTRNGPAGLITASAIGAGGVGALMHPYIGVPIAATGLAVHFAPQILLKVLQNPTMAQNLSKAVTSPAGSYAQRGAVQMLTQFAQRVSKTISPPTPPSGQDQQQ